MGAGASPEPHQQARAKPRQRPAAEAAGTGTIAILPSVPDGVDEFCESGNQFGDCVDQQCDGDNLHGFSPRFVSLNWRDVNKESQRGRHSAKGRRTPETGTMLHTRRTEASSLSHYETAGKFVHDHTRGGREESLISNLNEFN